MSALRMAFNELRRITSGKLPKLAVLALALVPLLYASLYLYANKDPYANLNHVPAALVVKDKGAKDLNVEQGRRGRTAERQEVQLAGRRRRRRGRAQGQVHLRPDAAGGLLRGAHVRRAEQAAPGRADPDDQRRQQLPGQHDREPGRVRGAQGGHGEGLHRGRGQAAARLLHDPPGDHQGRRRRQATRGRQRDVARQGRRARQRRPAALHGCGDGGQRCRAAP